jgi:outer membrane protein OmpA-like peptidoglycan-associated protein
MKQIALGMVAVVLLAGCAGQPEPYTLQAPGGQTQTVTMPHGTMTGGASAGEANALAKMVVDSNNNTMQQLDRVGGQVDRLQATENKELQTSQQALAKLQALSQQQGTGEITLFFPEGSARLEQGSLQYQRLVTFLDYLSRDSRGRQVILVSIGSASAIGNPTANRRLSVERSEAPLPVIDQYLVNVPHKYYKVYGLGDMYAPQHATAQVEHRYQSVRLIAVYETGQLPATPAAGPPARS